MIITYLKEQVGLRQIITLSVLAVLLVVSPFNSLQFVLLAGGAMAVLFVKRHVDLIINRDDLPILIFISLAGLSLIWSNHTSVGLYHFIVWLLLFIWALIARSWLSEKKNIWYFSKLIQGVFWILLIHQLIAINFDIPFLNEQWNGFLFKNSFYTSSYLVALYSFVLFSGSNSRLYRFVRYVAGALVLNILFLCQAYPAMIALFLLFILFVLRDKSVAPKIGGLSVGAIAITIAAVVLKLPVVSLMYGDMADAKFQLLGSSINLFGDNSLLGVGIGQWITEVYQYGYPSSFSLDSADGVINRLPSHNFYLEKFGELGFIGGFAILVAFIIPFWRTLTSKADDHLGRAMNGVLLVYILMNLVYHDVNFHFMHFSSFQLLVFISIGYATKDATRLFSGKVLQYGSLVVLMMGLVYFNVMRSKHMTVHQSMISDTPNVDKQISSLMKMEEGSIYYFYNKDISVTHRKAQLLLQQGDSDEALVAFQKAYERDSYNATLLGEYIKALEAISPAESAVLHALRQSYSKLVIPQ